MTWLTRWLGKRRPDLRTPRRRIPTRPTLEALETREVPTVQYFGGNLLTHVEAQALFLGNEWSSAQANSAQTTTLNSFLGTLTGGAYMDALTQAGYGVGRGTATAGLVDNTALTPGSTISDASIQARILADINQLATPDPNRLYVVYVEPNVAVNLGAGQGTTQQGILGYHGAFAGPNGSIIRYAVVAYPGGSVGNSSLGTAAIDQLTAVTSHELAEAATDPDVNFGRLGWYDPWRGEIGDITENNPNAYVRLNGYLVQEVANQFDQLLAISTTTTTPPSTNSNTTTTMTAGPVNYYGFFATASLTVTVSATSGSALPSGIVELVYNGQVLGTARIHVHNGVATATFNLLFFANGNYTFTAQYLGSSSFQGSSSSAVTVTV
jgi:hypothetical protein